MEDRNFQETFFLGMHTHDFIISHIVTFPMV
jgi:hypothetical protein